MDQSLKNRLISEAKQSPGKAVFLGAGLILAIYMWYPLVLRWIPKASQQVKASSPAADSGVLIPSTTPEQQIIEESHWYQQYLDFQQTNVLEPWQPEFRPSEQIEEEAVEEAPESVPLLSESDLEKLTVSAVLIGGRTGPMANLNGAIVREGNRLWIDFSEPQPKPSLQILPHGGEPRWMPVIVQQIQNNQVVVKIGSTTRVLAVRKHQ